MTAFVRSLRAWTVRGPCVDIECDLCDGTVRELWMAPRENCGWRPTRNLGAGAYEGVARSRRGTNMNPLPEYR